MNTKRILFGLFACATLMVAASCTDSTAEDDQLFEQTAIHKNNVQKGR